jgi:hypothetical protein
MKPNFRGEREKTPLQFYTYLLSDIVILAFVSNNRFDIIKGVFGKQLIPELTYISDF